jgi:hypothetical protein
VTALPGGFVKIEHAIKTRSRFGIVEGLQEEADVIGVDIYAMLWICRFRKPSTNREEAVKRSTWISSTGRDAYAFIASAAAISRVSPLPGWI